MKAICANLGRGWMPENGVNVLAPANIQSWDESETAFGLHRGKIKMSIILSLNRQLSRRR